MRSPFPGMDPYLEDPALWPSLHHRLITYISDALQPVIRPRYNATIGERLYVLSPPRAIYPDVTVVQPARLPQLAGLAPAMTPDAPVLISLAPEEIREPFIEIIDLTRGGQVVTVIEVLSPANKTAGEGHTLYRRKQVEVLASETHLVEIDLLRQGLPTIAVPPFYLTPYQPWHSLVSISRAGQRDQAAVYPIPLSQRLPRFIVPLAAPDPDAVVDLQAVFDHAYENGAYADRLDYTRSPVPPLEGQDAAWAETVLRGGEQDKP